MAICTPLLIAAENGYLALDMYLSLKKVGIHKLLKGMA